MRVLRAFLVAVAALAAGAAMAPGAWAYDELGLTFGGTPAQLIVGDVATVTAKVTNLDPLRTGNSLQVNIRALSGDGDPTGLPTLSGPGCDSIVPPNLTCSVAGLLAPGGTAQIPLAVGIKDVGLVTLQAGARAFVGDPNAFPPVELLAPQVQWQATVEPKADITLNLSANSETIATGASVTIKALVTNTTSEATAYGSAVTFTLPPEVEIASQPDGCSGTRLNLTCPVGDLGPQLTAQRLLTLRSTQEGQFTVLAAAKWARPNITDTKTQTTVTVLPPPDTSGSGTPTPNPTPVSTKARAASFNTLVTGAPSTGRCVRTRRLSIVLRSIRNVDPVSATIRVTGRRRALVLKGSKAQSPFSLSLPRSGKATVSLTVTLESGRRYTAKRTYRLC